MLPIVRLVDEKVVSLAVPLSTETRSSDDQKLEALRRLDQFRQWSSLEEKRYCLVCGNVISGAQIQVVQGTPGKGLSRLKCPTEGCNSIPMDWVLPTNEILAKLETVAAAQSTAATVRPVPITNGEEKTLPITAPEHFMSRLYRFAFHLRRPPDALPSKARGH